ncbi:hypothetical protein BB561_003612 [Smittium simulii]|uniref:N-acetyltransferase domain-containing protein n=1 Tax=Smittium simulii TaxID=133385 RepID=A0A2T9YKK1_9FUNG|nr:hypothetical protein BB561_003612 [Smittium simulii]
MNQNIILKIAENNQEVEDAFRVREIVLTDELGFDIASLTDEIDEVAKNVICYALENSSDGVQTRKPIGTLRYFVHGESIKVGRVAVLKDCRGQQIGKKMMLYVEDNVWNEAEYAKIKQIALSSIHEKMGFYEKLGYVSIGEAYLEEEVPHIYMTKKRPQL